METCIPVPEVPPSTAASTALTTIPSVITPYPLVPAVIEEPPFKNNSPEVFKTPVSKPETVVPSSTTLEANALSSSNPIEPAASVPVKVDPWSNQVQPEVRTALSAKVIVLATVWTEYEFMSQFSSLRP